MLVLEGAIKSTFGADAAYGVHKKESVVHSQVLQLGETGEQPGGDDLQPSFTETSGSTNRHDERNQR